MFLISNTDYAVCLQVLGEHITTRQPRTVRERNSLRQLRILYRRLARKQPQHV